jgi:transmembrane sensor
MVEAAPNRPTDMTPETAQQWFVLLHDDDATDADRQRFAAWLAADPAHARAWAETEQLWTRMDSVVPALRARDAWPAARKPAVQITRRGWLKQAAAAALVLGGGVGVAVSSDVFADHRTGLGERRTLKLADGSTIELDADSALSVAFSAGQRRISLHRGRAFFQVASDASRPFVVVAGNGEIRALGTAFSVKIAPAGLVQVAVSEHAVGVSCGGETARVDQGRALTYDAGGIGQTAATDIASQLAWRQDRLFFQEAPLREVVADLDRYRPGRILILDDDLADLPVTGFFHAGQTEAALQTIEATLPVRLARLTDRLVVIRRR